MTWPTTTLTRRLLTCHETDRRTRAHAASNSYAPGKGVGFLTGWAGVDGRASFVRPRRVVRVAPWAARPTRRPEAPSIAARAPRRAGGAPPRGAPRRRRCHSAVPSGARRRPGRVRGPRPGCRPDARGRVGGRSPSRRRAGSRERRQTARGARHRTGATSTGSVAAEACAATTDRASSGRAGSVSRSAAVADPGPSCHVATGSAGAIAGRVAVAAPARSSGPPSGMTPPRSGDTYSMSGRRPGPPARWSGAAEGSPAPFAAAPVPFPLRVSVAVAPAPLPLPLPFATGDPPGPTATGPRRLGAPRSPAATSRANASGPSSDRVVPRDHHVGEQRDLLAAVIDPPGDEQDRALLPDRLVVSYRRGKTTTSIEP